VTGGLEQGLACLERLVPSPGSGEPVVTVSSASLRRVEPERWGGAVSRWSGPPVRVSITLDVLFAAIGPGGN
jgi:hypothetical protein